MGTAPLGTQMHVSGTALHGALADEKWIELLHAIATTIGMTAVGEPAVWTYPVNDKGGNGQTIVLPITDSFLALTTTTESYFALDTWRDHSGAFLFVCSCRPYHTADIDKAVEGFGLKPARGAGRRFYNELNLSPQ